MSIRELSRQKLGRATGLLVVTGVAVMALNVSTARAGAATVSPYTYEQSYEFSTTLPECLPPDAVATGEQTEFGSGLVVENDSGISVRGEDGLVYHLVFPDGSFVDGTATEHFAFIANGAVTVYNLSIVEPRTIYSASGDAIGSALLHARSHVTYVAATDQVTATVDQFFFTCM